MGTLTLEHKAGVEKLHTGDQEALELINFKIQTQKYQKKTPLCLACIWSDLIDTWKYFFLFRRLLELALPAKNSFELQNPKNLSIASSRFCKISNIGIHTGHMSHVNTQTFRLRLLVKNVNVSKAQCLWRIELLLNPRDCKSSH
jgi:hypothetical protein